MIEYIYLPFHFFRKFDYQQAERIAMYCKKKEIKVIVIEDLFSEFLIKNNYNDYIVVNNLRSNVNTILESFKLTIRQYEEYFTSKGFDVIIYNPTQDVDRSLTKEVVESYGIIRSCLILVGSSIIYLILLPQTFSIIRSSGKPYLERVFAKFPVYNKISEFESDLVNNIKSFVKEIEDKYGNTAVLILRREAWIEN